MIIIEEFIPAERISSITINVKVINSVENQELKDVSNPKPEDENEAEDED